MDEDIKIRQKPNNLEAETAVIGSMIMDRESLEIAANTLVAEDFYNKAYGILFKCMVELNSEGKSVDAIILSERLKSASAPEEMCSVPYIASILREVPVSVKTREYVDIIKEKAILRNIIQITGEISNDCYSETYDTPDVIDNAQKKLVELLGNGGASDITPIKQVAREAIERIELLSRQSGDVTGIPSGFHKLDYFTSGFQNGALILLAARPAMGKTAFALNIIQHVVLKAKIPTAMFSLEMSNIELFNRLLSIESNVDAGKVKRGKLTDGEWNKILMAAGEYGYSKLYIDDESEVTLSRVKRICRKLKMENNLGLIVIDYLQLMSGEGNRSVSRQEQISTISRGLKNLAKELNVPVIALSQLSRKCEERDDKRPIASDLRESGAIEQDADIVMFIYRDEVYNKETSDKGIAEIIVNKNRSGPTGTIKLAWLADRTKFENLETEKRNQGALQQS